MVLKYVFGIVISSGNGEEINVSVFILLRMFLRGGYKHYNSLMKTAYCAGQAEKIYNYDISAHILFHLVNFNFL